jgi:hypothetical protein
MLREKGAPEEFSRFQHAGGVEHGLGKRVGALTARARSACAALTRFAIPSAAVSRPGCCWRKEERVATSGKVESTAETNPRLLLIAIVAPVSISQRTITGARAFGLRGPQIPLLPINSIL